MEVWQVPGAVGGVSQGMTRVRAECFRRRGGRVVDVLGLDSD